MKCSLLFIVILSFTVSLHSQNFCVEYFDGKNKVDNIKIIDNNVWASGSLGLTRINKNDLEDKETIIDPFVDHKPSFWDGLYLDKTSNNLYVHDRENLFRFEDNKFKFITGNLNIWKDDHMYVDENNVCWLISYSGSYYTIIRVENDLVTIITPENSNLPDLNYCTICVENDVIWLGTGDEGIVRYENNTAIRFTHLNSDLPPGEVKSIDIKQGVLWAMISDFYLDFTPNCTLVKFYNGIWTNYPHYNTPFSHNYVNKLKIIDNRIYLGTPIGLMEFDGTTWKVYDKTGYDLKSNNVFSFAVDANDIWIGTDKGLSLIRENLTTNLSIAAGPFSGSFQGPVIEDMDGTIWVGTSGTYGNLCKKEGEEWTEVIKPNSYYGGSIISIAVDLNNVVWGLTYSDKGTLYRVQGDSISKFYSYYTLPLFPHKIIVDKYNNKWIVTSDELIKYNDSTWTIYNTSDCTCLQSLNDIETDSDGNVWITAGRGLVKYDGSNWIYFNQEFFGIENYYYPSNLIIDKNNILWIQYSSAFYNDHKICKFNGTELEWLNIDLPGDESGLQTIDDNGDMWFDSWNGLARFDWEKWTYYNDENTRLLNHLVYGFYIDSNNNKWISANNHLAKFNEDIIYSKPTIQLDVEKKNKFTLFPNPTVTNNINVMVNEGISVNLKASIIDILGQTKIEMTFPQKSVNTIDLSGINEGVYLIRLVEDNKIETHKFIKTN